MSNELDRITGAELDKQWRAMNAALERLGRIEGREIETRGAASLIFALDLTGSRQHSLKQARIATAAMFDAIKSLGAVAVKLIYYRGESECKAGEWEDDPAVVSRAMRRLSCESGETQIWKVLRFVRREKRKLNGVVLIADHCEDLEHWLLPDAEALGAAGIPIFVFHEIADDDKRWLEARPIFRRMAELSGGAYCPFGAQSADALRELLSTVAAFSAAGTEGVKRIGQAVTAEGRQLQGRLLLLGAGADTKKER